MRSRLAGGAALTAAAIVCLHLVLSLYYWLESPALARVLTPTWDLLGLIAVIAAAGWVVSRLGQLDAERTRLPRAVVGLSRQVSRLGRRVGTREVAIGLTVLLFAIFFLGLGQGFARREFGYDVVMVLHLPYVPELFRMMYNAESIGMFLLYTALLGLSVALIVAGIYVAARRVLREAVATRMRRLGMVAGVAVYAAVAIPLLGIQGPVTARLVHQIDLAMNLGARLDETGRSMALETAWLKRKNPFEELSRRPSIYIFIVESYGEALYSDEDFSSFRRVARESEERLREAGFTVRSRLITAPVFGGSSWMSDMALLCGVRVFNQQRFEGLSTTNLRCMSHLLGEAGYRTVLATPNTTRIEYKSTGFLKFDQVFFRGNFEYKGPRIGWGFMPDQYMVQFVHEREISKKKADEPLFVTLVLTNSHHPWSKIPRYIEDWSTIGDGKIYEKRPIQQFRNTFVGGDQMKPAFLQSIEYSWKVVMEYLLRTLPDDTLIVIYGDHQPRKPVADMETASWDVPIHVLSRDPALVERFASQGYVPGMTPGPNQPKAGSESFLLHLFKAFSAEE
jgi:MFS family permease